MTDTINTWLTAAEGWLAANPRLLAVVLGLVAALLVAQVVKVPLAAVLFEEGEPVRDDSERVVLFRWFVRLTGAAGAMTAVVLTWPPNGARWLPYVLGAVLGGIAHPLYKLGVRMIGHKWPWLSITAKPPDPVQRFKAALTDTHTPPEHAAANHDGINGGDGT